MTKDKLEKEAEQYAENIELDTKWNNPRQVIEQAYIAGYNKAIMEMRNHIAELENENAELKRQVEQKQHLADVRLEQSLENYKLFSDERKARIDVDIALDDMTDQLTYAKTIIQDLLHNTDEYARQRAEDFLKEE